MKLVNWLLVGALFGVVACGDDSSASGGAAAGGQAATGGAAATGGEAATGGSVSTSGGAPGTGGSTTVEVGDIAVTVNYAGTQVGTLNIAAVTSFPPAGPPVAFQSVATPTFPAEATLIGLETGQDYYVAAVLDVDPPNPQSPGPEDLIAVTMPAVQTMANGVTTVELTLTDPMN